MGTRLLHSMAEAAESFSSSSLKWIMPARWHDGAQQLNPVNPQALTLTLNSIRNPLPLLGNNATLEIIDGVMEIPILVLIMGK